MFQDGVAVSHAVSKTLHPSSAGSQRVEAVNSERELSSCYMDTSLLSSQSRNGLKDDIHGW